MKNEFIGISMVIKYALLGVLETFYIIKAIKSYQK